MFRPLSLSRFYLLLSCLFLSFTFVSAQQKVAYKLVKSPVLWEESNIKSKDLFYGPGGQKMLPDLSKITFIKQETGGHNKKYRIKDGSGRIWVAKTTREAKAETAAVRMIWALGYKTEINYFVPSLTIPGKGTFKNVRLEARPDNVERLDEWKWGDNPFLKTRELQGLKIMMVFLTNWDVYDGQNKILKVTNRNFEQIQYIISDLGATFGRLGNNNLPLFYRFGRQIGKPNYYIKGKVISKVENNNIKLAYKGKNRQIFTGITVKDAAWLANLLNKLSDKQIRDAFRAANFNTAEINTFTQAVKNRIVEVNNAAKGGAFAQNK